MGVAELEDQLTFNLILGKIETARVLLFCNLSLCNTVKINRKCVEFLTSNLSVAILTTVQVYKKSWQFWFCWLTHKDVLRRCFSRLSVGHPNMFNKSAKNDSFQTFALSGESLKANRFGKAALDPLKLNKSSGQSLRAAGDSRSDPFRIDSSTSYKRSDRVGDDAGGDDYYRFKLSKKRDIEISVENDEFFLGPSLDFRLLNKNGGKIKSREVDGGDTEEIERTLGKGTYFIKVESGGESVPYRLKYKSESPDDDD